MASDVVSLIKNDHRLLEGLFEQLEAGKGDRRALVEEVTARLTAHARAEEQEVYPALERADPDQQDEVQHGDHEHHEAERLLRKVRRSLESNGFDQALSEFVEAVSHHVEEEETEILPALRKAVDTTTLQRLGVAFEQARLEYLRDAGFGPEPGAAGGGASGGAGAVTKQELYEQAREAGIPGRSTMSKDELSRAVEQQG